MSILYDYNLIFFILTFWILKFSMAQTQNLFTCRKWALRAEWIWKKVKIQFSNWTFSLSNNSNQNQRAQHFNNVWLKFRNHKTDVEALLRIKKLSRLSRNNCRMNSKANVRSMCSSQMETEKRSQFALSQLWKCIRAIKSFIAATTYPPSSDPRSLFVVSTTSALVFP